MPVSVVQDATSLVRGGNPQVATWRTCLAGDGACWEKLFAVPANRSFGLRVSRAVDGYGEVELPDQPSFANGIGSLHARGLVALVDAATSLAAVTSAADTAEHLDRVVPLGASAVLMFRAPARGALRSVCRMEGQDIVDLRGCYRARMRSSP